MRIRASISGCVDSRPAADIGFYRGAYPDYYGTITDPEELLPRGSKYPIFKLSQKLSKVWLLEPEALNTRCSDALD